MKHKLQYLFGKWYLIIPGVFLAAAAGMLFGFGEDSIIAVHDNLDLFVAQFQMLKNTGAFWAQGAEIPFLGGITRDGLPSEFSLYTLLYMAMPSYYAYVTGYLLKIVIAMGSAVLLFKDIYREAYGRYRPLIYMTGFAYGILNVFPAFGIPFASLPLLVYLLRRIQRSASGSSAGGRGKSGGVSKEKRAFKGGALWWYGALFLYPWLSYFSYFGLFILGYMTAALLFFWIREKRFPKWLFWSVVVLAAGYMVWEYRLFALMLFGGEETIRSTMEAGSFSAGEILRTIREGFTDGMFHAESVHRTLVLPVCLIYSVYLLADYVRKRNLKGFFRDSFVLILLFILFNSVVYGIYYWEGLRSLIETICPPLTGWQFNRTIFFNPFLWYCAFFLALKRLYETKKLWMRGLANCLMVLAVLFIVFSGTRYNDFYHTGMAKAYEILKGRQSDTLSYGEFYSAELFEKAMADIGYQGEWSAAYGFHPTVLEYNGIATLDGYLGFYDQSYKEEFRKIIAPALARVPESRDYFDTWGARAYLYSGTDLSIVQAVRNYQVTDQAIYIDTGAFRDLGGVYIFSRIELTNAFEAGLTLTGTYTDESSPYVLYVYRA